MKQKENLTIDQKLFESFKHSNERSFEKIYQILRDNVFFFVLRVVKTREDAEDITINSFIKTWDARDKIDNPMHLKRFIFITARNESITFRRDKKYFNEITEEIENDNIVDPNVIENEIIFSEVITRLWNAVKELPPIRQKIFLLRYQEKKSLNEICDILNLKYQTVVNQLTRAKNQLYDSLK